MNQHRQRNLRNGIILCQALLRERLSQLDAIEKDSETSIEDKRIQIEKIREEINKVGAEIDILKREIMLLETYSVN